MMLLKNLFCEISETIDDQFTGSVCSEVENFFSIYHFAILVLKVYRRCTEISAVAFALLTCLELICVLLVEHHFVVIYT